MENGIHLHLHNLACFFLRPSFYLYIVTLKPTIYNRVNGMKVLSLSRSALLGESGELFECQKGPPKRLQCMSGIVCTQVACGEHHTAVVTNDGKLYTFGLNHTNGQVFEVTYPCSLTGDN